LALLIITIHFTQAWAPFSFIRNSPSLVSDLKCEPSGQTIPSHILDHE